MLKKLVIVLLIGASALKAMDVTSVAASSAAPAPVCEIETSAAQAATALDESHLSEGEQLLFNLLFFNAYTHNGNSQSVVNKIKDMLQIITNGYMTRLRRQGEVLEQEIVVQQAIFDAESSTDDQRAKAQSELERLGALYMRWQALFDSQEQPNADR